MKAAIWFDFGTLIMERRRILNGRFLGENPSSLWEEILFDADEHSHHNIQGVSQKCGKA